MQEEPILLSVGTIKKKARQVKKSVKAKPMIPQRETRAQKVAARQDPPRFKGQTNLERLAVSRPVALDYAKRINDLKIFVRLHKLALRPIQKFDEACCMFLNCIFEQGVDLHEGTKLWAAVADAFPDFGQKDKLPRTRRALQGWHKVDPQRTRPPIPWQLVAAISMKMLARQRVHSSLAVLTMFAAYLRPSECLSLQKSDLMKPMPGHKHYSLHLHPSARQEVSKVGLSDESILLDSVTLPWLGLALDRLDSPDQYLFNLHYSSLAHHWKQALVDLGLQAGHCVLYQLRHAGPSHDRLHHLRSALEVKQRGRWAADSSVRRYEAHGRVSQEFYLLPDMVQQESTRLEEKLQREGLKCFCPQRR
jgi:hypothetical protein